MLLAAGVAFGPGAYRDLHVATGYLAKRMCSCIFVAGRNADSCRADLPESMNGLHSTLLEDADGGRASLFGIAERIVHHHPGSGCTLSYGSSIPEVATSPGSTAASKLPAPAAGKIE